jgi:hypothetical protein
MQKQLRSTCALLALAAWLWVTALLIGSRPTAAQVTIQITTTPTMAGTPGYLPLVFKDWPSSPTPDPRTPAPTRTLSLFQFNITPDTPAYLPNFANSHGCAWFGVSGQVFDLNYTGILGLIVRVTGPGNFQADTITGSAPKYGASGFEVTLGATPIDSNDYRIQLRNGAGQALSENYVLVTSSQCNRNHIIVNFEQNH